MSDFDGGGFDGGDGGGMDSGDFSGDSFDAEMEADAAALDDKFVEQTDAPYGFEANLNSIPDLSDSEMDVSLDLDDDRLDLGSEPADVSLDVDTGEIYDDGTLPGDIGYIQGNNEEGLEGDCGLATAAGNLNRVTGSELSENDMVHTAEELENAGLFNNEQILITKNETQESEETFGERVRNMSLDDLNAERERLIELGVLDDIKE